MRWLILFFTLTPIWQAFASEALNERILEDPLFKKQVDVCQQKAEQAEAGSGKYVKIMSSCVEQQYQNLEPEVRKQLSEKYILHNKNIKKITNYQKISPRTYEKNIPKTPEYKSLVKYLTDRLNEAIYGTGEVKKIANHGVYYELYKNQISKNIVLTLSSFCLEASNKEGTFYISSDANTRKLARKSNLSLLGSFDSSKK